MNSPGTDPFDADPEIQQMTQKLESALEETKTHLTEARFAAEAEARAAESRRTASINRVPDAAQLSEWNQMEAAYGAPSSNTPAPPGERAEAVREAGIEAARHIGTEELVNTLTEKLREHIEKKQHATPRLWFYGHGDRAAGPMPEQELAALLKSGTLSWDTLVWHEGLGDWKQASETELPHLAKLGSPPPLGGERRAPVPPPEPAVARQRSGASPDAPVAETLKCPACGSMTRRGDRFCSGCGRLLTI